MKITDAAVQAALEEFNKASRFMTSDVDKMYAALTVAYPHLPLGYEVKQLEWETPDHCVGEWRQWQSVTTVGRYILKRRSETKFILERSTICIQCQDGDWYFKTMEEAKAAAQADFERRVRECLVDKPADLTFLAQSMLSKWERWISTESKDKATETQATDLLKAACFAGLAYEDMMASPITADAAPSALLRIFLTAIIDPTSTELDAYRAKNRPDATLTNEGTKPVDVAAVRRQAFAEAALTAEEFAASRQLIEKQPANIIIGRWEGEQAACAHLASAIRALSAEPAQGEQWQPIELVGDKERLITIGSYNAKGVWCAEVWHTKYLRDEQAKSADGFFINAPHLEWVPTHFMELPVAPTPEAGR